jgi:hypothetical protein
MWLISDPSVHPDADDTAKAITALQLLGQRPSFDALIERFELESHFQCFPFERNPSFSANCNVLLAFLYSPDPSQYQSQITKCVRYIAYEWWNTDEPVKDKWVCNSSFLAHIEFVSVLSRPTCISSAHPSFTFVRISVS